MGAEDAAIQLLLKTLFKLTKEEIQLLFGVEEERDNLSSNFRTIQAVLKDAELNPPDNEADRDWLIKLQDAVFEVEDILDECIAHFSKPANSTCCGFMKGTSFRHKIAMRMKAAATTLDLIAKQHADYQRIDSRESQPSDSEAAARETGQPSDSDAAERETVQPSDSHAAARETGSLTNKTEPPIGREDEKEMIVDILLNQVKANQGISILPIIGVGGLGKTTFAQLLFNDLRVVEHFDKKLWVCVSDNFDVKTLIKAIIENGTGSAPNAENLDTLQSLLRDQLLIQKRYLLVLDDVWNDDMEKWSQLKNVLSCGAPGSSIIITTRLGNVADITGTLPAHNLKGLTEEQCWMLLKQRAFRSEEKEKYPNLEDIGKQIAKKCAGVPLAAKVLGALLRFQRSEKEWIYVKENEVWNLEEAKNKILPVLRLSYQHLPLYLRQCFAYCAIFPKNSQIDKEDLIHRWMGHGYISSKGSLEVEDVGEQIYNELIVRSLFQNNIFNDGETSPSVVTMHDLVHDLAQSIMESKVPTTQLEVMLKGESDRKIREVNLNVGYVAFPKSTLTQMDISVLKKYNRLRVLNASCKGFESRLTRINHLPSTVGCLQHLRSLNLSYSGIRSLPNSICDLWNLQVLNLNGCRELVRFCKKMRNLKNLRHLFLEDCSSLRETPSYIRELTFLRTLSKFIVGSNKGNGLEQLEHLNLKDRLMIRNLDRVKNLTDAEKANLYEKGNLRELHLYWFSFSRYNMDEKVLAALQPHSHVKHLRISGFGGKHFPTWMKMSTLVEVKISYCKHITSLSPLEEMPHLEFLSLSDLEDVVYIGHGGEETSLYFPALRKLELYLIPNLKRLLEVKVGQGMCPQLQKLIVQFCPLFEFSSITFLEEFLWNNNPPTSNDLLKHPAGLETLIITDTDVQCLPQVIRYLPSLKNLHISNLNKLTSLPDWLGDLTSLETLKIHQCPKLASLPDSIQGMTNLRYLEIDKCPDLAKRYEKEAGEYWHKIAHIERCAIWTSYRRSVQMDSLIPWELI